MSRESWPKSWRRRINSTLASSDSEQVLGARIPLLAGSTTDGPVMVLVRPEAVKLKPDPAGPDRVVGARGDL